MSIDSPASSKLFKVAERITLTGSATDPQDGQLPNSALKWEVRQHHNGSHYHPFLSAAGNNRTFSAPAPEDLAATGTGNYLEIRLSATDSQGLSKTVTQELQPRRVNVTLASQPTGAQLRANGLYFSAPRTFVSWEGYNLRVYAPSPQTLGSTTYVFGSWSDGKGQEHDILTGAQASSYTAAFKACTITGTSTDNVLIGTSADDIICGLGGNDTISGSGGNDQLEGMSGNDVVRGGVGSDKVRGSAGADKLYGEDGNDTVNSKDGVNGNDSLDGGTGTDVKLTDTTEASIVGFP